MKKGAEKQINKKPSYLNFDHANYQWKKEIDYRKHPEQYLIGKGEQGVLTCEPYKSEIVKYWRFKNQKIAKASSEKIYQMFLEYLQNNDFIGADMARKFLQMGYTRARRYANYKGGKKYDEKHNYKQLPIGTGEEEKAKSARIFYKKWLIARNNKKYCLMKKNWKEKFENDNK